MKMNYGLLSKLLLSNGSQKYLRALAVIVIAVFFAGCGTSAAIKNLVGTDSPTLRFYRLEDGSDVTLYSYPNTDKLILFWNTKCGPSKRALTRLDRVAQKFATYPHYQGSKKFTFIAANIDPSDRLKDVKDTIEDRKAYSLEHMMSGNAESDQAYYRLRGESLPYLIWIDQYGVIKAASNNDEEILDQIP